MSIRDLISWDRPFNIPVRRENIDPSLSSLQGEMNRLFERFYNGSLAHLTDWEQKLPSAPALDVTENGKAFRVRTELASIDPEDVDVEISGGFLTIKGEKEEESGDEDENYLRREISYGSFCRTVSLPETADSARAEARFKNGVLTVTVPKKAEAIQEARKLQIKKAA